MHAGVEPALDDTRTMSPMCPKTRKLQASAHLHTVDEQIAGLEHDLAFVAGRRAFLVAEIANMGNTELDDPHIANESTTIPSDYVSSPAEQQGPIQGIETYLETPTALPGSQKLYGEQLIVDEVFYTCMAGFKAKNDGLYLKILHALLQKMNAAAEAGIIALNFLDEQQEKCEQVLARSRWQARQTASQSPRSRRRSIQVTGATEVKQEEAMEQTIGERQREERPLPHATEIDVESKNSLGEVFDARRFANYKFAVEIEHNEVVTGGDEQLSQKNKSQHRSRGQVDEEDCDDDDDDDKEEECNNDDDDDDEYDKYDKQEPDQEDEGEEEEEVDFPPRKERKRFDSVLTAPLDLLSDLF